MEEKRLLRCWTEDADKASRDNREFRSWKEESVGLQRSEVHSLDPGEL